MCKWCDRIPCDDDLYEQDVSREIRYSDGAFYTQCGDFYYDMPLNYCPHCGKRLKLSMIFRRPKARSKGHEIVVGNNGPTWDHLANVLREWT